MLPRELRTNGERLAVRYFWESGGEGQNRTVDTTIFSRMLYQLSYLAMPGGQVAPARNGEAVKTNDDSTQVPWV